MATCADDAFTWNLADEINRGTAALTLNNACMHETRPNDIVTCFSMLVVEIEWIWKKKIFDVSNMQDIYWTKDINTNTP